MPQEENNTSCINTRAIIEYIRNKTPERVRELFRGLPGPASKMPSPEAFLCDENNWVSSSVFVRLFDNAKEITGDSNVAYDVGFQTIARRELSYVQKLFLQTFSPRRLLRRINQINGKLNNTKIIETVSDSPGRIVIRWHWRDGIVLSKDTCLYNQGIYSAINTLRGRPPFKIKENACYFSGGPYCEIVLTWSLTKGWLKNTLLRMFTRKSRLRNALDEIERDKTLLKEKFDQLNIANQALSEKVRLLKAVNTATRMLVSEQDIQLIFEKTIRPIVDVLGFSRALIMLTDPKEEFLEYRYGVGEDAGALEKMKGYRVPLDREKNLMIRVFKRKKPVIIRDVKSSGLNPANIILADFRPTSFIVCPIIVEDKPIGLLGADRGEEGARVTEDDLEFLSILSNSLATAIHRAWLDEELKSSYASSVRALVQAIEEKDTYTRGHSQRVAAMVVETARVLGMPERDIEYLRFGSILHDVGKIGIPESIVQSSKPLSETELRIIQQHTRKGVEILQPIAFLKNHLHIIRNHHERFDGKGYPDGLQGDEIPLGAQIVAVADAFDAMTSSRPYRKGMPFEQAAKEIQENAGTQFSPIVAEAFLKVLQDPDTLKKLSFLHNI